MVGAAAPARAETSPPPPDDGLSELRQQAMKALDLGKTEEAIKLFRAAWELRGSYFDICTLANLQVNTQQWRSAAESYESCKKALPEAAGSPKFKIERKMMLARSHVGALTVTANVPGAKVFVDNKLVGKIPLERPIFVDPGWYAVEIEAPGYVEAGRVFEMKAGQSDVWNAQLEPSKVSGPRAQGVTSPAPKPPTSPPVSAPKASPPRSDSPAPYESSRFQGNSLEETGRELRPLQVAGISVGIVGLGISSVSFVAAYISQADATDLMYNVETNYATSCSSPTIPAACKDVITLQGRSNAYMNVGLGGLAIGAMGLAFITYDIFSSTSPKKKASAQGILVVQPGGGALQVTGTF
jgi:hypothetical protein